MTTCQQILELWTAPIFARPSVCPQYHNAYCYSFKSKSLIHVRLCKSLKRKKTQVNLKSVNVGRVLFLFCAFSLLVRFSKRGWLYKTQASYIQKLFSPYILICKISVIVNYFFRFLIITYDFQFAKFFEKFLRIFSTFFTLLLYHMICQSATFFKNSCNFFFKCILSKNCPQK